MRQNSTAPPIRLHPGATPAFVKRAHEWLVADRTEWLGIGGLFLAGIILAALSLYDLGQRSLWLDEVASVVYAKSSLADLLTLFNRNYDTADTLNMSLYYLVLHFWLGIGETEARIRLLSVVFGVVTLIPIYLIGRQIAGTAGGVLAALVFSASQFAVRYSQEARGYTLLMLVSVTLTWLLLRAYERPSFSRCLAYGLVAALGLYVHFFFVFVLLAHALWAIATRSSISRRHFLAAAVPVVVAAIPIPLNIVGNPTVLVWVPALSPDSVRNALVTVTGSQILVVMVEAIFLAVFVRRGDRRMWLLLSVILTPLVLAIAISAFKPILVGKYLAAVVPAMAIMAGVLLASVRPRVLQAAAILGLGLLLVTALPYVYGRPVTEDWRGAGRWVAQTAMPGDTIAYLGSIRPMKYYLARADGPVELVDTDVSGALGTAKPSRLWFVVRTSAGDQGPDLDRLETRFSMQERRRFGTSVWVYLMTPIPTS